MGLTLFAHQSLKTEKPDQHRDLLPDAQVQERGTWTWVLHGALSQNMGHEPCSSGPSLITPGPTFLDGENKPCMAREDPKGYLAKQPVNGQEQHYSGPALETEGGHEITKFITTGCRRGQVCKWVGEGQDLSVEVGPAELLRYFRPDANPFSGSP